MLAFRTENMVIRSTSNPSMSIPPSSEYYFARIYSKMKKQWKFSNELEFEKEYSKVHYSELDFETSRLLQLQILQRADVAGICKGCSIDCINYHFTLVY